MVEVPDAPTDPSRAARVADPETLAELASGARWHPSSPRVSPLGRRVSRAELPGDPLVIDCVIGWTTSSEGESW
jgi:hypothetical protein